MRPAYERERGETGDTKQGEYDDLTKVASMQLDYLETTTNAAQPREHPATSLSELSSPENPLIAVRKELLERFPNFKEVTHVGDGGTGTVVRITTEDGKELSGKLVSIIDYGSRSASNSTLREAVVLKNLSHPALCEFYGDIALLGGTVHVVLSEFAPGKTLKAHLEEVGEMSPSEVTALMKKVLSALDYLHNADVKSKLGASVIHRDIKPENIIIGTDGDIKIIDFGGSHISGSQTYVSATTNMMGTLGYSPKEVLVGGGVPSSDLYSLGVTALECLGVVHHDTIQMRGIYQDKTYKIPISGKDPEKLIKLLQRMIEHKESDRFQSAREVLEALEQSEILEKPRDSMLALMKRSVRPLLDAMHGSFLSASEKVDQFRKTLLGYLAIESIPILDDAPKAGRETFLSHIQSVMRGWGHGIACHRAYQNGINKHGMTPEGAKIYARLKTLAAMNGVDTMVIKSETSSATFEIYNEAGVTITAKRTDFIDYYYRQRKPIPQIKLAIGIADSQISHEVKLPAINRWHSDDHNGHFLEKLLYAPMVGMEHLIKYLWSNDSHFVGLANRLAGMVADTQANPEQRLMRSEMLPERGALPMKLAKEYSADDVNCFVNEFLQTQSNEHYLSFEKLVHPLRLFQQVSASSDSSNLKAFSQLQIDNLTNLQKVFNNCMATREYHYGDYVRFDHMLPEYSNHLLDLNAAIKSVYDSFRQRLSQAEDPIEVAALNEVLHAFLSLARPRSAEEK